MFTHLLQICAFVSAVIQALVEGLENVAVAGGLEGVDQRLDLLGVGLGGDQQRVWGVDDDHVFEAN